MGNESILDEDTIQGAGSSVLRGFTVSKLDDINGHVEEEALQLSVILGVM